MSLRAKLLTRNAATNYEEMFSAFYKALDAMPEYAEGGARHDTAQMIRDWVPQEIAWAKKTFKSNTAWITWWLRFARVTVETITPELRKKDLTQLQAKGMDVSDMPVGTMALHGWHREFEHLMATPAPELTAYRPGFKSIPEVVSEMKAIEREWQDSRKGILKPQEGDTILIQFPDGWVWWLLDRNKCDEESRAMGHCGNGGSYDESQKILSLRQPKGKDDWEPHLTFILEGNGFLGEMKGKNNDKPVAKYHPYIIALLENPIVKGIAGGGYMPKNNFAVSDLTQEQRDKLFETKPELMTPPDYFAKYGVDEKFVEMTISHFKNEENENISWNENTREFVMTTWTDVTDLVNDEGNDTAKNVIKYLNGDEFLDLNSGMSTKEEAKQVAEELSKDEIDKLGRILAHEHEDQIADWLESEGYDPEEDEFDTTDSDDVVKFADYVGDAVLDELSNAYMTGLQFGTEEEMSQAFKSALEDSPYKQIDPTKSIWDGPWADQITPEALMKIITDGETLQEYRENEDGRTIQVSEPYYGFSDYDEKSAIQAFKDNYDIDGKFVEVFGEEGVAAFEQEKATAEMYQAERKRLLDDIRSHFKDASPEVKRELENADRQFRAGDYEPLVKMVQAVIPDAFQFHVPAEQPAEVATV